MHIQTHINTAVTYAGSRANLAKLLGITKQAITAWGDFLPQSSAQKLYILTDGYIGARIYETES